MNITETKICHMCKKLCVKSTGVTVFLNNLNIVYYCSKCNRKKE